jgi:hypothetical protein
MIGKITVHVRYDDRALSHSGGNPFDRIRPDIANGVEAGNAGRVRRVFKRACTARDDKTRFVQADDAIQEFRVTD